jgi:hypothetical protein
MWCGVSSGRSTKATSRPSWPRSTRAVEWEEQLIPGVDPVVQMQVHLVWTFKDSKVVRRQVFQTEGEALEAAGLHK